MFLIIESRFDEGDGEPWNDVSGREGTETYALDCIGWKEWLGMKISYKTLRKYSKLDIIAHCLWEMTYHGYEQKDIDNFNTELCKAMTEIKKDLGEVR